jgi:uncharacterized protein YeaO (DUF488 family)
VMSLHLKRAYDPASAGDGRRYLVERLWPRGVKKEALALTAWLKDLAPSTELRRWYNHDLARWPEFVRRYGVELQDPGKKPLIERLGAEAREHDVTLVFAAKDGEHSSARVLRDLLETAAP